MDSSHSQCRPPPILSVLVTSPHPVTSAREGTHGAFTSSQAAIPVARKASAPVLLSWSSVRAHLLIRAPKQPLEPFLEARLKTPDQMVFVYKVREDGLVTR